MAKVTVSPDTFTYTLFDAPRIAELVSELADRIGLPPDLEIRIEVEERSPLGRTRVTSLDPVTLSVEGGAFEDAKKLRHLSDRSVNGVCGRLLFRIADRLSGRFDDAPADADLESARSTAWDTYAVGRCAQLGYPVSRQRRLYHFRIRHGFTDTADAVFQRLWTADGLSWADVAAASDEAVAAKEAAPAG
jgi:hypothetical protein